MKHTLLALAFAAVGALGNAQVGDKANLDVVQWYNTAPIPADLLQGHATLVEVFRTW